MNQYPTTAVPDLSQRAAVAVAQAARLRGAAVALRRFAGSVRYHPITGQRPQPTVEFTEAVTVLEQVLNEIQRGAADRAQDEAALASLGDGVARQVRRDHQAIEQSAQVAAAALQVLRGVLSATDEATLDAPYGHGAPSRHHPGALCTIVAERVEALAVALESAAVLKANLTRRAR
ncbi:MAG: hypothetical protein HY355_07625 [Armatimonadetes bacterium]|nr:hypothetical protein [Armatimonadota bacterium]